MADYDIPTDVPDEVADRIRAAVAAIADITVENREYALDESDLPDGETVYRDRSNLPYVVDGERPLFTEFAVDTDGEDVWIACQATLRHSNWKEQGKDYAALAYDIFEEHGISRPTKENLPDHYMHAGVKFGTLPAGTLGATPEPTVHGALEASGDVIAVETVIPGGAA